MIDSPAFEMCIRNSSSDGDEDNQGRHRDIQMFCSLNGSFILLASELKAKIIADNE